MLCRITGILTLILFLSGISYASGGNEIIYFEDLEFNSEFERKTFEDIEHGKENLFRLFAAIDPDVTESIYEEFEKDLSTTYHAINTRKFSRARPEKKIEYLYGYVNEKVLNKYQEKILFPHLFVNGTFNCLTASAYYGFLMDSLNISFDFRETTSHVHPVAFPENEQIKIETTNRIAGIEYYDEKLKTKFVNYLVNAGIITKEEYYKNSVESLFNLYFFPESSIGLKELAGLHYMNDALYKFHVSMFEDAFIQIKKAYYLYSSERMLAIYQFMLAEIISIAEFNDFGDAKVFVYLSRFSSERVEPSAIENLFLFMTDNLLLKQNKRNLYDEIYYYLMDNISNEDVSSRIEFQYNLMRGKALVADYKFREGLELLENAFKINPRNLEVQSLLITTFAFIFQNAPSAALISQLEEYGQMNPELLENGLYNSLKMNGNLKLAQENFDLGKSSEGMMNLSKFEQLYESHPGVEFDHSLVASAYSAAAVYYFKNYDTASAKRFLEKGLSYAPGNFELEYRLRSL